MKQAIFAIVAVLGACSPSEDDKAETPKGVLPPGPETRTAALTPADLPAALAALVQKTVPNMTVAEVERKEREGRIYYDVEGSRPDGSAVELDIQQIGDRFEVVEIQRDIVFADMPAEVRSAARAAAGAFVPERIIESRQTDGSVIYELFAAGQTAEPAMEVRAKDGNAKVMTERWPH
jgi:hypothetical protein